MDDPRPNYVPASTTPSPLRTREHRRLRFRRRRRKAFIRSVYALPSLATLGNAICGFTCIFIAGLPPIDRVHNYDPWAEWVGDPRYKFVFAALFIFLAMVFDAMDGRLARFTRHTTDFGGQLDSLADAISFGAAPAFLALFVIKDWIRVAEHFQPPLPVSRLFWAVGALFMSCALIRLARFNVSNQHGEQHHFSFLGLPSPGAAGAVAAWVLMQQHFVNGGLWALAAMALWMLPLVVLTTGLLMVSTFRYPHLVNRYLRGRRSMRQLMAVVVVILLLVVAPQVTVAAATFLYSLWGVTAWAYRRVRPAAPAAAVQS